MIPQNKNQNPFGPLLREIVADATGRNRRRMRQAVWLYFYLIVFANARSGKLISRIPDIAAALGVSENTVNSWLGHLKKWHYVSVVKMGNGLHFRVNRWQEVTHIDTADAKELSRSSGKALVQVRKISVSLPKEPDKMARKIAVELRAEDSLTYIENLCRSNPRNIIQRAFNEARDLPAGKIKKSRGALFVYLTKKYAKAQ